jgi:hypothetical protein
LFKSNMEFFFIERPKKVFKNTKKECPSKYQR